MTNEKKLSVVTISYNQIEFLGACIESVLAQKNNEIEYIVVDPGSTDGSRELILSYGKQIDHLIFENDSGPADGLNKGFALASGSIFYYLNSDDIVRGRAFSEALEIFDKRPEIDVLCGAGMVIDANGKDVRRVSSDPISRLRLAYGGGILIQPSTFVRSAAFRKAGGFNAENKSNWDGELIVDLFLQGARFHITNKIWGSYRLHQKSITATGRTLELIRDWNKRKRFKLGAIDHPIFVGALSGFFRLERLCRSPHRVIDRLVRGRVFGSAT